ncbi:MAG: DUF1573 domain-containing protein [Phycisphaerales bacterium]|nr:DUF1573 domain-containing protein [Phycisphaerales bacterium]
MRSSDDSSGGGLSTRAALQLVAAAVILVALVGLSGGFFGSSSGPSAPPRVTSSPPPKATLPQPGLASAVTATGESDAPVSVTLEPSSYAFGFLRPSEVRSRTLVVTNRESQPIRLKGTWKGCSCTTLDVQAGLLGPGESREVTATLTAGLTPTTKDSSVKLEVTGRPPIVLPMTGEIIRGVRARPRDISTYAYRGAEGNYRPRGSVTLDAPEGVPFRILAINGQPQQTEPSLQHTVVWDVSQYDATTGLDADGELVPRFWLVETDHPDTPVMELRVSHRASRIPPRGDRPWFFTELYVNAGPAGEDGNAVFTLPIKGLSGLKANADTIRGVRSLSDEFTARLRSLRLEGRDVMAEIVLTPVSDAVGAIKGQIMIEGEQWQAPLHVVLMGRPRSS